MNDPLDAIRSIIQHDVGGRGLKSEPDRNLITACAGDFHLACRSVADVPEPSLAVLTGFFIPTSTPPAGETDGPLGALFLARALVPLGIKVVLVTDDFCTTALQAGLEAACLHRRVKLITLPNYADSLAMGPARYWSDFMAQAGPLTHLLAVERVGPNHTLASIQAQQDAEALGDVEADFQREVPEDQRDRCRTMRGRDITEDMSPAHWLSEAANVAGSGIVTLGVGDGGNEIGMGKIAWDVIRRNIPRGGLVACRVPVRHLIVCGISNWGAYGLAAGVRLLRKAGPDAELFDTKREYELLQEMVDKGPLVDGVAGVARATVDGLEFSQYAEVLGKIAALPLAV